ncbi:FAD/NAD(P)-binding protein [Nesterenkonia sedimenti]|uniref:FAD/NAD(P)-binding protein n=1 Tax=Nesterenkonia sedimenti TaxID=1463632 RepID=UPI002D21E7F4|nr:FAD/NAD(P)-binding protein [Nesterenkonia sedimenti]
MIGAGPRGTSFLERLLAHVEQQAIRTQSELPPLRVLVIDPARHGSGKIWDPEQSPRYLMNTPASFPTAAPAGATQEELTPSSCSTSFLQWAKKQGLAYNDGDFPRRADYGAYLRWLHQEAVSGLRANGVSVEEIPDEVTSISAGKNWYGLLMAQGPAREANAVILALGHVPAEPAGPAARLSSQAQKLGLHYQVPAIPTDVDYNRFEAGENVLVRGMGLNFFDLMIEVTAGRGGRFKQHLSGDPGHRLDYQPSGQEPILIAGSRRGTPYRAKTVAPGFVPEGVELTQLTDEVIEELIREHQQLDFAAHLWPLIEADMQQTYRRIGGDPQAEFKLEEFTRPFDHQFFGSAQEYQQAMATWLTEDAATAAEGAQNPQKMAVNALHAARLKVKHLVTERRITQTSLLRDVEGWFEATVEGLTSGPPLQRIEELAALARAGIVQFLGPSPVYGVEHDEGLFIADSSAVSGARYTARYMIEAMMPPNRITQSSAPLVRSLLEAGTARPATFRAGGESHVHKGFAVTDSPHRLLTSRDSVVEGIYVLGLQLSSAQWGTAIAAEAGGQITTTARSLADADAVVVDILSRAPSRG